MGLRGGAHSPQWGTRGMTYELIPFTRVPERSEIISKIIRSIASHETLFSDYGAPCGEECVKTLSWPEMCETCKARMSTISLALTAPNTRAWEVWNEESEVVGIIYFSDILPGLDAKGHYVFWDEAHLRKKTPVIQEAISLMFEDVGRLTIEIPASFAVLARHAQKKLGFGGPFRAKGGLQVEGVKRSAVRWRGEDVDLLILGRLRTTPTAE